MSCSQFQLIKTFNDISKFKQKNHQKNCQNYQNILDIKMSKNLGLCNNQVLLKLSNKKKQNKIIQSIVKILGWSQDCLDTGWEKIMNMKPERINSSSTLYLGLNSQGLVNTCFER